MRRRSNGLSGNHSVSAPISEWNELVVPLDSVQLMDDPYPRYPLRAYSQYLARVP